MPETKFHSHSRSSATTLSLQESGADLQLSPNFQLHEFRCRDGSDTVKVHPALVELLEAIRARANEIWTGSFVHINSGYRSPAYNARIPGSARNSYHVSGLAADIVVYQRHPRSGVQQISPNRIALIAEEFGTGGVGRYSGFTHVDVGKKNRRW